MKKDKQLLILQVLDSGRYRVKDCGTVYSSKLSNAMSDKGRIRGYVYYSISAGGRSITVKGHQMTWLAFNRSIPEGMQLNHKNGIKHDNRLENLELVTSKENIRHSYSSGLAKRGQDRSRSKLTDKDVTDIRYLLGLGRSCGFTHKVIAGHFGVSRAAIANVSKGRTWTHV